MHVNVATTISFAAVMAGLSVAALSSRLARSSEGKHFRFSTLATLAATLYAGTEVVVAGAMGRELTVWAGRVGLAAICIHAAAWLFFFAAWDRRALTRAERIVAVACIVCAPLALVPGVGAHGDTAPRVVAWLGVTYNEPVPAFGGVPIVVVVCAAEVLGGLAAFRRGQHAPRARYIVYAFVLLLLVAVLDTLSAIHVLDLPYFASLAVALVPLFVASAVAGDLAESTRELAERSAELAGARAALVERERLAAVGQLAAVVAHEVRNPVAIIYGALAALKKRERDPADAEVLAIVEHEARRLERLVVRLLDSVRPFEIQYTMRPIASLVTEAVTAATSAAGVPASEVLLNELPPDALEGDSVLLGQAVLNLVANALDANGRRSPVRVTALVVAGKRPEFRVEITDDGEGVAEEHATRLFTPFFTTRATGTGLGLALVKRIAEAHGGSVKHQRPESGGASFVMRVPLGPPADGARDA